MISAGKESACNAGDPSSIPGLGRSPEKELGYPLQYSWASLVAQMVKDPPAMGETWGLIPELVRSPGKGNGNSLQYSCLEIPWTEEPGVLQSMGLQGGKRVGRD